MMNQPRTHRKGIVSLLVLFIIAMVLIGSFKVDVVRYLYSTPEQALNDNFVLIIETGKVIWTDYIRYPIAFVWNEYIVAFVKGEWLGGLDAKLKATSTLPPE
ncbi:MAG TPA: hypothetical protein VJJ22_04970 [Candidatus Paceibacterota bacterium]